MVDFSPFRALRFSPDAPRVAGGGRGDVAPLTDAGPDDAYGAAARTYAAWRANGLLHADRHPALWILDIGGPDGSRQSGLVAALHLDEQVVPHEDVEPALVAERAARLRAVPVDLAPVAVYSERRVDAVTDVVAACRRQDPDIDILDERGGRFRLWRVADDARLHRALHGVRAVVADGHHRVAAARRALPAGSTPATLAFVIPHEPDNGPVHRLLFTRTPARLLADLRRLFTFSPATPEELGARLSACRRAPCFGLWQTDGQAHVLTPRDVDGLLAAVPRNRPQQWRSLDQVVWAHAVLPRLRDVTARPATAAAPTDRGPGGAPAAALLMLRPIPTGVVTELAVAGVLLPPKVTYFTPKARTGLLLRPVGAASA